MRFTADGPLIPDELLVARDAGDVIFFCGAGVSQAEANLPSFETLSRKVIDILGSALDSPARRLLNKAFEMGRMAGVGGLLATDRVFSLLEREFEVADVRTAISEAIRPAPDCGLTAHRTLRDLATSRAGVTRLVTTNFDLLFEKCDSTLPSSGPPHLPDPRSDHDFRGIVHLHGRVDPQYLHPQDDEFVVSSADFGRAYLSEGWATRFIQALLARFQIVFVGYSADDPPVQYLLEALNLRAGDRRRLFAFQEGESGAAAALWEHRGVQAIAFDGSNGFAPLWDTLHAWAERARDVDGWYARLLAAAASGPVKQDPHVRGQIAHVISTREGARRIAVAPEPLPASWLLVFDPNQRYASPGLVAPFQEGTAEFDPFASLCLDDDASPEAADPESRFKQRKVPENAWDVLGPTRFDSEEVREPVVGALRGESADIVAALPPRLASIGDWIQRVAHQPVALWWAVQQNNLYPSIKVRIEFDLRQDSKRFPEPIHRGWRNLLAAWNDTREDPDHRRYDIEAQSRVERWSPSLVRQLADLYRPRLKVEKSFEVGHPLRWNVAIPDNIVRADVSYPRPHEPLAVPDDQLRYAVTQFRRNLELAIALEHELTGHTGLHFETSRADDDGPELSDDSYGLTGLIICFQRLVGRLVAIDIPAARAEAASWPSDDEYVFARLRIWACGTKLLSAAEAAQIFLSFSDNVFWGSLHERDLLFAFRDRWRELPEESRKALEHRLLTGSYPWPKDVRGGRERVEAFDRLSRLHWLLAAGVVFNFDVGKEIDALRLLAPEWTERAGEAAADSHAPYFYRVQTDTTPDAILETPIAKILMQAGEAERLGSLDRVRRDPFRGLATLRPARALAALSHAARHGEAPLSAWSAFLYADGRLTDSVRLVSAIAARLERLPLATLRDIVYPVSEWMERIASRLYTDAAAVLPALWNRVIDALAIGEGEHRHRPKNSWADDALNAPVGKLANLVLKDPRSSGLAAGAGYPAQWTDRLNQLLELPGDLRRHAMVIISYQLRWLYTIDPVWTEHKLLPAAENAGNDGEAFWDGVVWAGQMPSRQLFARLKPGLLARALKPRARRNGSNIIAATLLAGWGGDNDADQPEQYISDIELREVLIVSDDELRGQVIWHLKQWSSDANGLWRKRVIPFFKRVWPKQRALRTPALSARLTDFAFACGDLMPVVVELIRPMLVPARASLLYPSLRKPNAEGHSALEYPRATLDLLWAVLGEDPQQWPYKIEDVLDYLATAPETSADPRLSELRRRRER